MTLAVNMEQARALKVVDGRGDLWLTLRNAKDMDLAKKGGPTTLPGLLGIGEPQVPFVSEIYVRGRRTQNVFSDGLRQKVKLDPPFGLPVHGEPKNPPGNELEVWPTNWGWGGWGGGGWGGGGWGSWGGLEFPRHRRRWRLRLRPRRLRPLSAPRRRVHVVLIPISQRTVRT